MSKTTKDNTVSDWELVQRFNQGDKSAFRVLTDKYAQRAYQIAFGVLRNREDAEEVAQDAFVRIYKALPSFRGEAEFTTWMYRIVVNLSRNKYRWKKTRGFKRETSMDQPIEDNEGNQITVDVEEPRSQPDEETQFHELQNRVEQEMNNLPPAYREALILRNVEEMNYDQIAEVLGCKLGTIKSRIARAREELRRRLEL